MTCEAIEIQIHGGEELKSKFTLLTPLLRINVVYGDAGHSTGTHKVKKGSFKLEDQTKVRLEGAGKQVTVELWQDHRFGRPSEILGVGLVDITDAGFKGDLPLKTPVNGDPCGYVTVTVESVAKVIARPLGYSDSVDDETELQSAADVLE